MTARIVVWTSLRNWEMTSRMNQIWSIGSITMETTRRAKIENSILRLVSFDYNDLSFWVYIELMRGGIWRKYSDLWKSNSRLWASRECTCTSLLVRDHASATIFTGFGTLGPFNDLKAERNDICYIKKRISEVLLGLVKYC